MKGHVFEIYFYIIVIMMTVSNLHSPHNSISPWIHICIIVMFLTNITLAINKITKNNKR